MYMYIINKHSKVYYDREYYVYTVFEYSNPLILITLYFMLHYYNIYLVYENFVGKYGHDARNRVPMSFRQHRAYLLTSRESLSLVYFLRLIFFYFFYFIQTWFWTPLVFNRTNFTNKTSSFFFYVPNKTILVKIV